MQLDEIPGNYDYAAARYDRWMDLWFGKILRLGRYRRRAVDRLGDLHGKAVLDVGCGTGLNLPLLAPRVGPDGRIVAVDYSEGMLEQARRRVAEAGWTNVELVRGDAVKLDGVEGPFDAVLSTYCLGIVYDVEGALERMLSLLRLGGRLSILDFHKAKPDRGPLRWLYPLYSRVLQREGIDTARDLDDARVREHWRKGKAILRDRLVGLEEETFLQHVGFLLAGSKRPMNRSRLRADE